MRIDVSEVFKHEATEGYHTRFKVERGVPTRFFIPTLPSLENEIG